MGRVLRTVGGVALGAMLAATLTGSRAAASTLRVAAMSPEPGAVVTAPPAEILITLSAAPDALSINTTSVVLTRAGLDGAHNTGDDVTIAPVSVSLSAATVVRVNLTGVALPDDDYQIRVRGNEVAISGLVSHWKLDEGSGTTAADASGGGYPGTISGAGWTTGRIGNALSFDGIENRVTIAAPDIPVPWTAAIWAYRENSPNVDSRLTDNLGPSGTSLRMEQYNNTNQVGYTQGGVADYTLGYTAPVGAWTHLTFVGQAGGVTLYANGSFAGSNGAGINLSRGCIGSQGGNTMLGKIDDVRIYNRALTASEILAVSRLGGVVRDAGGNPLDGELGGALPSGDGSPGGDFVATFTINAHAPLGPTNLTATPFSTTRIDLAWQDNAWNEDAFEIERGTDGVTFSTVGTAAEDASAYSDGGLSQSTPFYYRVRARNALGTSSYSNVASASPVKVENKSSKCGLLGLEWLGLAAWILRRRRRA